MATSNGLPPTLRVEELDSGNTYGYVLPDVAQMVLSGFFPTKPVKEVGQKFAAGKFDTDELLELETLEAFESFKSRLVAWMVRQLNGKTVSFTADQVNDPEAFPTDDREALLLRGVRAVTAPKAQKVK